MKTATVSGPLMLGSLFVLLTACASMAGKTAGVAHRVKRNDDAVYIAKVEGIARQRGTKVVWINPPDKRVITQSEESQ